MRFNLEGWRRSLRAAVNNTQQDVQYDRRSGVVSATQFPPPASSIFARWAVEKGWLAMVMR
jgi:hypothetical protein